MKTIKVVGFANGAPCPLEGQYVETFDFEAHNGQGYGTFTPDIDKALKFVSAGDAMDFWRTQSKTVPLRVDGRPNRPLTSCHVVIE